MSITDVVELKNLLSTSGDAIIKSVYLNLSTSTSSISRSTRSLQFGLEDSVSAVVQTKIPDSMQVSKNLLLLSERGRIQEQASAQTVLSD